MNKIYFSFLAEAMPKEIVETLKGLDFKVTDYGFIGFAEYDGVGKSALFRRSLDDKFVLCIFETEHNNTLINIDAEYIDTVFNI